MELYQLIKNIVTEEFVMRFLFFKQKFLSLILMQSVLNHLFHLNVFKDFF